jgi:hypothetical protein
MSYTRQGLFSKNRKKLNKTLHRFFHHTAMENFRAVGYIHFLGY